MVCLCRGYDFECEIARVEVACPLVGNGMVYRPCLANAVDDDRELVDRGWTALGAVDVTLSHPQDSVPPSHHILGTHKNYVIRSCCGTASYL